MSAKYKYYKVLCPNKKESKKRPCFHFLGGVQIDVPVIAYFHCRDCCKTYEVESNGHGLVYIEDIENRKISFSRDALKLTNMRPVHAKSS